MSKVDFFIVGAPKSGTTALHFYLFTHPDIFLPAHKEPNFFSHDYPDIGGRLKTLDEYEKLYSNHQKKIAGDCSVTYLASDTAPQAIYKYNPEAKMIIMLRHPVDLFISEHSQLLYSFYENIELPFDAWQLQEKRRSGDCIPASCREPGVLQYKKICTHGTNLQKYRRIFPAASILTLFFEDFVSSPHTTYLKILDFLELPDDGRSEFPKINDAKFHKQKWLAKWLISPPGIFGRMHEKLRRFVAATDCDSIRLIETAARNMLERSSEKRTEIRTLSKSEYGIILDEMKDEIRLLSSLTGKNLSHWGL